MTGGGYTREEAQAFQSFTGRAPVEHDLKTWPEYFQAILEGRKPFEYRLNDRGYQVGDVLHLREWVPDPEADNGGGAGSADGYYTGRQLCKVVTYILDDRLGPTMKAGFVVMGLSDVESVGLSMGRKLHDAWQAVTPPSGWGEPVKWDDFDSEQQTLWDKAAVRFACLIGPASDPDWRPTHRHLGRGTEYRVVGEGFLQTASIIGSADDEHVTIYQGADGRWWVRPTPEFGDGRFEALKPPPGRKP